MEIGLLGLLIIIALATYFKKSFESDTGIDNYDLASTTINMILCILI